METALIIYTQDGNVPYVADLYENETIALQYSFNDIKDLKPSGTYSRTFRIRPQTRVEPRFPTDLQTARAL